MQIKAAQRLYPKKKQHKEN